VTATCRSRHVSFLGYCGIPSDGPKFFCARSNSVCAIRQKFSLLSSKGNFVDSESVRFRGLSVSIGQFPASFSCASTNSPSSKRPSPPSKALRLHAFEKVVAPYILMCERRHPVETSNQDGQIGRELMPLIDSVAGCRVVCPDLRQRPDTTGCRSCRLTSSDAARGTWNKGPTGISTNVLSPRLMNRTSRPCCSASALPCTGPRTINAVAHASASMQLAATTDTDAVALSIGPLRDRSMV